MPGPQVLVSADITFHVDVPGAGAHPTSCAGRVRANGREITIELSPTPSLGGSATRPLVRPLANHLDRLGLTVEVVGSTGALVRLGAGVRAPWWQIPLTHGARIQLGSLRALLQSLGGPAIFEAALPPAAVLPAVTGAQRSNRRRAAVAARQALRRLTSRRR